MPDIKALIDTVLLATDEELSIEDIQIRIVEEFDDWLDYDQIYHILEGKNSGGDYYRTMSEKPYTYQILR